MSETIIVALLSLAGTLAGSLLGILAANKLVVYRIEQLEKKVEKHNSVVERMAVMENKMTVADHRISDLEGEVKSIERCADKID